MAEQSEEKTLPASEKKLHDARLKGQVPHSKDLISAFTFVAASGYVLFAWRGTEDQVRQLIDIVASAGARPFTEVAAQALAIFGAVLLRLSLLLAAVIAAAVFLGGLAVTGGPVFAFDPLQPKLERINPAEGLKRLFSVKGLIEFLKTLLKVLILAPLLWLVLRGTVQAFFEAPVCGAGCYSSMLLVALTMLLRMVAICLIVFGILDLILQRRLFLREMRMTQTEAKREHKNMEGDPHIRHAQQRLRRQLMGRTARVGLRNATFAVMYREQIVALRFNQQEMNAPVVVAKGRGANATRMIAETRRLDVASVEDETLTAALYRQEVGTPIHVDLFGPVAAAMRQSGVLGTG
jgi:type III secretion protein U